MAVAELRLQDGPSQAQPGNIPAAKAKMAAKTRMPAKAKMAAKTRMEAMYIVVIRQQLRMISMTSCINKKV